MNINPKHLTYSFDKKGYKLFYKGICIGGAGIKKAAKGCPSNIKLFKDLAEREIKRIVAGFNCEMYLSRITHIEETILRRT